MFKFQREREKNERNLGIKAFSFLSILFFQTFIDTTTIAENSLIAGRIFFM